MSTSWPLGVFFSLLTAALLWLGLPGGGEFWPVLFLALLPFLLIIRKGSAKQRFVFGLLTGFSHFILVLYWIVIVLGHYGGLPWFISVPALALLALYMSLYFAIFGLFSGSMLRKSSGITALLVLPALWVGLDWLRSFLFSGFPWLDLGYGLWRVPVLIQSADLFGHFCMTYVIVLVNCLLFSLFSEAAIRRKLLMMLGVGLFLGSLSLYGDMRWQHIESLLRNGDSRIVGIVQGNIDQSRKWSPEEQQNTVDTYLDLSRSLLRQPAGPELIVWPETALPFFPTTAAPFGEIQRFAKEEKVAILTGSPWFNRDAAQGGNVTFFNSAFLLLPSGEYGGVYFKSHLVPFGEYVPLKKLLPFIAPLVEAVGDFTPGKVEMPLSLRPVNAGVLICFESIFPDIARHWVKAGANVLVNLTNDAWYGRSSAPVQSMAMSVFRAVETRRSLVRAANTGISGFVDPLGQVRLASDIFIPWAGKMDVSLVNEETFHSQYGYLFAPLCLLVSLLILALRKLRGK